MENLHGQMEECILESGTMVNNMDKEITSIKMEKGKQEYGKMESEIYG